ncbi:MAG: DUF1573 domain-containing protein [Bacteroidales bacterium]|nr:DUF1573 domain-containing protein [Bacteroidales bacterium]
MKLLVASLLSALLLQTPSAASLFDRTVHDFGTIRLRDGAVHCTFTLTNTGEETLHIYAVITSCGCTSVTWTREDIPAGGRGTVQVTYANDEGPYPFDKPIRVYLSSQQKPVLLHIKGIVRK